MKQQRQNKFLGYLKNVPQTHNVTEDKPTDDKYNIYIEYNLLQKNISILFLLFASAIFIWEVLAKHQSVLKFFIY